MLIEKSIALTHINSSLKQDYLESRFARRVKNIKVT